MNRYKITISYDGTNYCGWQLQPGTETVQSVLERTLNVITGEKPRVHGSGRTDSGVHAAGQVAHFDLEKNIPPENLYRAMNAVLPDDIRITGARTAPGDFHARRSAVSKEYRYFIWNKECMPPFLRLYRTHINAKLNVSAMNEACARLRGQRNFAAFTANPNRIVESTVRNLSLLEVTRRGAEVIIKARSEGFLYKMVRSLAGFLIRVGDGSLAPDSAQQVAGSLKRTAVVPTAPAKGLFLWKVFY